MMTSLIILYVIGAVITLIGGCWYQAQKKDQFNDYGTDVMLWTLGWPILFLIILSVSPIVSLVVLANKLIKYFRENKK